MAKSFDGLIRHLIDQIALCGEHGESSRFLHHHRFEFELPTLPMFEIFFFTTFHVLCNILPIETLTFISLSLCLPFSQTSCFCK